MSDALVIDRPGLVSSIQDLGRLGLQRYGVPVSGVLDPLAARLANALVGNNQGEAVLEMLALGPSFLVEAEALRIALVGSAIGLHVDGATIVSGRSVTVSRGSKVAIPGFTDSACCYLAISGGFAIEPVMGSRSTYARGGFGGFAGRSLKAGDRLPLRNPTPPPGPDRRAGEIAYGDGPIRIVPGPQGDWFEPGSLARFFAEAYEITAEADRMGMRLAGPALIHSKGFNIASDGIATGAIQVPGTGQPIVLLADHQTIGGYPKLGTVASADLSRLGRCRPGQSLRFVSCTAAEAETLRRTQDSAFRALVESIAPLTAALDSEQLLAANLISGVVSAETILS
ncbi:MAG: biotin-dependent carboxyltransferase family protein, partial [Aliidongia sp.]